jgi:hypothetical protein
MTLITPEERQKLLNMPGVTQADIDTFERLVQANHEAGGQMNSAEISRLHEQREKLYGPATEEEKASALAQFKAIERDCHIAFHRAQHDLSAIDSIEQADINTADAELQAAIAPLVAAHKVRVQAARDRARQARMAQQALTKAIDKDSPLLKRRREAWERMTLVGFDRIAFNQLMNKVGLQLSADLSLIYDPVQDITAHTGQFQPFFLKADIRARRGYDTTRIAYGIPGYKPEGNGNELPWCEAVIRIPGWLHEPLKPETIPAEVEALYDQSGRLFWMKTPPASE